MSGVSDPLLLQVLIEGSDVTSDVVSVVVEDDDTLLDQATVTVSDPIRSYTDFVQEGMTVRVTMGYASRNAVMFDGRVARVRGRADRDGRRFVSVVALDPAEAMHRTPRFRHHVGTVTAVVTAIVSEYGLIPYHLDLGHDPTFTPEAPLRQADLTDWAFILDLAQRYEARAFVEYTDAGHQFYLSSTQTLLSAPPVATLSWSGAGGTLVRFDYRRAAERAAPSQTAALIDPTGEVAASGAMAALLPEAPVLPDAGHAAALGSSMGPGAATRYTAAAALAATATSTPAERRPADVAAGVASDPDAIDRAELRPDDPTALGWVGRARATGDVLLRAKQRVTFAGVGAWADGDWYVARARHVWRDYAYHTELRDPMITHPQVQRHARRFYGKFAAQVSENADSEMRGWIDVTVPAVFGEELVVRARPCFPYAHHFVPPVGTHVWVEFEAGDPQYPLWTGVWYPPDAVPEAVVDPPTNRVIHTESGHTVELDDTEDAERIAVTHAGGTRVEIDAEGAVTVEAGEANTIVLTAEDGMLSITVEGDVTIEAGGAVSVTAGGDLTLASDGNVAITGSEIALN